MLYVGTLFNPNPKALTLVEVWIGVDADRLPATLENVDSVEIRFPGNLRQIGGGGYYGHMERIRKNEYLRFHSPDANLNEQPWAGKGYGFMLYNGACLAAGFPGKVRGIFSDDGRSEPAACLWASMLCLNKAQRYGTVVTCKQRQKCKPLAKHVAYPERPAGTLTQRYCFDATGKNVTDEGRSGRIGKVRVCGKVPVEFRDSDATFRDVLDTRMTLKNGYVVDWLLPGNWPRPPVDAVVNTNIRDIYSARYGGDTTARPEQIAVIASLIGKTYGKSHAQAFLSREDVRAIAAKTEELSGLERMPVRRVPGLSYATRRLIAQNIDTP